MLPTASSYATLIPACCVFHAQAIAACGSPEEAARLGRCSQHRHAHLVRPDWLQAKLEVMLAALRAKFAAHAGPRQMLLATASGREADAPLQVRHIIGMVHSCTSQHGNALQMCHGIAQS